MTHARHWWNPRQVTFREGAFWRPRGWDRGRTPIVSRKRRWHGHFRGTRVWFNDRNPVLSVASTGFTTDTARLKVGDGHTPWNHLPWVRLDL